MNEKQIMLRITIAQRMISEILNAESVKMSGVGSPQPELMSESEWRDSLRKAYSELNVAAMRGECYNAMDYRLFPELKKLVKELA